MIALFCSRRAGKTEEYVFEAAETMMAHKNANVIFVGLSIKSARNIFYKKFNRLNTAHGWPFKFAGDTLTISCPSTGSQCLIFGSDNRADLEKSLGLERVVLLLVDEAGAWRQDYLQYLIEEVAGPAMEDIPDSRTLVAGTPGRVLSGYWYDITTGKIPAYSVHSWTLDNNPFMPRGIKEKVLKKYGWTEDTPAFVMQYLGRWCLDPSTLVFSAFSDRCIASRADKPLPYGHKRTRILSLDFGVVHKTAYGVIETRTDVRGIHVPFSMFSLNREDSAPSTVADVAKKIKDEWKCDLIVGDLGGMGKAYAEEMVKRHKINIIPADKRDKLALIEMVNDGFKQGILTIDPDNNAELIRQLRSLQWDELHTDIAEGQADDLADMLCYGYKWIRPKYIEPPLPDDPYREPVEKKTRKAYHHVELR
jgi:hypothetical protein